MPITRVRHSSAALAVLLTAPFLAQADATIANVATPAIRTGLSASTAGVELVIGGYLMAFAVLLVTGARLGQTHGYKRLFLTGIAVFAVASLLCGLAPNIGFLVAGRILQGAGAALMFPQTLTGIRLNFDGERRARAIGLYAAALSGGAVTGQILGGVLISSGLGWRSVFLVTVPVCLAVAVAGPRLLPADVRSSDVTLDLPGVGALGIALLLLIVPLTLGREEGWPVWTWVSLALVVPATLVFLSTQRRATGAGRTPLVRMEVVRRPAIAWALVALVVATGTYYALLFTLAQYFQTALGRGALASALILVPWVAAFGLAGQLTRWLAPRFRQELPTLGYGLLTAAYAGLAVLVAAGQTGAPGLAIVLATGGLGLGIGFNTQIAHLTDSVEAEHAPDISGTSTTLTQIGGAAGVAAFAGAYLSLAPHGHGDRAFAITCLAMALGAGVAVIAARRAVRA